LRVRNGGNSTRELSKPIIIIQHKAGKKTLTVAGISVEHLVDNEQLAIPVGFAPFKGFGVLFFLLKALRHMLETPAPMIPKPVHLWV
jgi:hypothetical protein